jgi:hypothetical protein
MATVATRFDPAACLSALAAIEAEVNRLAGAVNESQFHAPPRGGGWSIGYCIEHLILVGNAFVAAWEQALRQAPAARPCDQSFPYQWWHRRLLGMTEPMHGLKRKTIPSFLPRCRRPMDATVRRFLSMHQEFARLLLDSRGLDTKGTKLRSPFASWLWYPLGFSFDLALAHERRHLRQAWEIRRQLLNGG